MGALSNRHGYGGIQTAGFAGARCRKVVRPRLPFQSKCSSPRFPGVRLFAPRRKSHTHSFARAIATNLREGPTRSPEPGCCPEPTKRKLLAVYFSSPSSSLISRTKWGNAVASGFAVVKEVTDRRGMRAGKLSDALENLTPRRVADKRAESPLTRAAGATIFAANWGPIT
jgi:hypothetical protein